MSKPALKSRAAAIQQAAQQSDLQSVAFSEIQSAAQTTATMLNMPNFLPVNEGSLGDFPWYYISGSQFNFQTYNWLNNVFSYSSDGYVGTNNEALTTGYGNVLRDITYVLDAADATALQNANSSAGATAQSLISDWTSIMGPIQSGTTQSAQLMYITSQVMMWAPPGTTLGQINTSTNPAGLLSNAPPSAGQIVTDFINYLGKLSSALIIASAATSANNQLRATLNNVNPPIPLTVVAPGFMQLTPDPKNNNYQAIVPGMSISEGIATIQNALWPQPPATGNSFQAKYSATSQGSNSVQITSNSGAAGVGDLGFFFAFGDETQQYNMFSFSSSLTTCDVTLEFNGVTTATPSFTSYDVSTGVGWWNPDPIEEAANPVPNQSGYTFTPTPAYDFGVNGTFGVISRLMISQQPTITLTYSTSDLSQFQQILSSRSSWGVYFLGIGLGGGSSSYYNAQAALSSQGNSVTVTMSPAPPSSSVGTMQQLAYVVGAQILWPGASTTQNKAGI